MRQDQMRQEQIRCSYPFVNEYYSFTVQNRTPHFLYYVLNGVNLQIGPGLSQFHQLPKAVGTNVCNVVRYQLPLLEFDSSFEPGMQQKSYRVGFNSVEYFSLTRYGLDLFH
jgi:hypothetical protein